MKFDHGGFYTDGGAEVALVLAELIMNYDSNAISVSHEFKKRKVLKKTLI